MSLNQYRVWVLGTASGALIATCAVHASSALAQSATQLPPVTVEKPKPKAKTAAKPKRPVAAPAAAPKGLSRPATTATVEGRDLTAKAATTSDTTQLLRDVPGVSIYNAGGVSSLPVIQGLADDRVKVLVNGAMISSACANHMNPPTSYVDPRQVKKIDVFAGVTPVSVGGDSIGGTIVVETATPQFAAPGEGVATHGTLSAFVRSNGGAVGGNATASVATQNVAVGYSGSYSRSGNYEDGNGKEVPSTEYEAQNHALQIAARKNGDLYVLEAGIQYIPYQGFPNQYMDMTLNQSWYINGRYDGQFSWGKLDARAFYREVTHEMNFLADKIRQKKTPMMPNPSMPMNTDGVDAGYSVKAEVLLSPRDMLRVGNEFHHQGLDDWWPPVAGMAPGMGPNTFWNINGGERNRFGTFLEWERKWNPQWTTLFGARNDVVWMDTGDVVGYSNENVNPKNGVVLNYATDAAAFNSKDHVRTDVNFDLTALARYEPNAIMTFEGGYARKTRSPNLYERYSWSTGGMASRMIGWYGDLNGYVGNLDLDPEVAHKLSFTVGWHDRAQKVWDLRVTPYYSYVEDFITAERMPQPVGGMPAGSKQLRFVNHDAELYGVDVSGRVNLGEIPSFGRFALTGVIGYVHGDDLESDTPLYHMMPWNARFALEHKIGRWTNTVELQLVDDKDRVDATRVEPMTPGYALVNLRTAYEFEHIRVDLGVENVFDKMYTPPLGGREFDMLPVPGMGRSFYAGVTMKF